MWWNQKEKVDENKKEDDADFSQPNNNNNNNNNKSRRNLQQQPQRNNSLTSNNSSSSNNNKQSFLAKKLTTPLRRNRNNNNSNNSSILAAEVPASSSFTPVPATAAPVEPAVAETFMGFEVSIDLPAASSPKSSQLHKTYQKTTTAPANKMSIPSTTTTVLNLQEELLARQKINRAQYSVSQWPALGGPYASRSQSSTRQNQPNKPLVLKSSRYHRVPFGESTTQPGNNECSAEDVLFLLRSYEVVDEMTSLKQEVSYLDAELDALSKDKIRLEESIQRHATSQQVAPPVPAVAAATSPTSSNTPTSWDVYELLASKSITVAQRNVLQSRRGNQLTVYFHDKQATEALANKCGIKPVVLAKYQNHDHTNNALSPLELNHDTCRDGGAATHLQQVSLLCKEGGTELSFFLGRDQTKSVYWGHLPDRLFRRMQDDGMNPKQSAAELVYLATGPMDAYYAEFRSGEAWWGAPQLVEEEDAFSQICTEWNVYRVVFGPVLVVDDHSSETIVASPTNNSVVTPSSSSQQQQPQMPTTVSSWIILSRDGRAAWKNLPSRLDHLLQSRMADQAGLAEVSLGCGDSYFCRFLDGTVDYCLPSTLAAVCQQLEAKGSTITSIALHPELSHDFVIRSTTVTTRTTPSS